MKQASILRSATLFTLALAGMMALPALLSAQSIAAAPASVTAPSAAVTSAPLAGPRDVQAGIARETSSVGSAPMPAATSRNVAWMIVGGAALVVGSVIGGDGGTIMMVAGGVIGLVGLFRYLQ
jgi:hypothetical protein